MIKRAWHHLGPIAGLLALVIALGGPAWAAEKIDGARIKAGTVTSKQLRNATVKGVDVKDSSLTGADVRNGSIGTADLAATTVAPSALSLPGLRTQVRPGSPNILGGASANAFDTDAFGGVIAGGGTTGFPNLVNGDLGAVGGGQGNTVDGFGATVPGGEGNDATGAYSLAAGRRAQAVHDGSFVWADDTDADFSSTDTDQFAIRAANGMVIANDAGNTAVVPVGTRFRDNAVVAWGRVTASGTLDTNVNVDSITKVGTGHYKVTLASSLLSGFSLVPVVTPEVDEAGGNVPPTGAANVRFAVTNQFAAGTNFDVYVYNGSFASVDNDFQFLVTGR